MSVETLVVTRLGQRGEGIAQGSTGLVFLPYALPTETVVADVDGDTGHVLETRVLRPDRVEPICPYYGACGGCAVQTLPAQPYAAWKRDLVVHALTKAGVAVEVAALVDAHGRGRRRATFHARLQPTPNVLAEPRLRVGFMRARAHEVIDITHCPILAPEMAGAVAAARVIGAATTSLRKPLDVVVTATDAGLDIDLRGPGPLEDAMVRELADKAVRLDLARLSNHGSTIVERRTPIVTMGLAKVMLPPGAFLQATAQGETVLSDLVRAGVGSARKVADLFCGLGTFALRLAETATVTAVDLEGPWLPALTRAARDNPKLRPVTAQARDLFRRPLSPAELEKFDAVVFDPPRAGAPALAETLAASQVKTVVAVSCNPSTFARDAATLIGGGYRLTTVTPVDQFLYSPHVELVAVFQKTKTRAPRTLFG